MLSQLLGLVDLMNKPCNTQVGISKIRKNELSPIEAHFLSSRDMGKKVKRARGDLNPYFLVSSFLNAEAKRAIRVTPRAH